MPCIQGSAHLPWLLSLSFKEFESTSKLPNFPSAVSCFSGAMASLVVRLVLNVSLNSAITLPFLHKIELKKWNHNHQKLRPPSACIKDILDKEISFLRFQQQYAFTRSVFESISHVHRKTLKNDGNESIPYRVFRWTESFLNVLF